MMARPIRAMRPQRYQEKIPPKYGLTGAAFLFLTLFIWFRRPPRMAKISEVGLFMVLFSAVLEILQWFTQITTKYCGVGLGTGEKVEIFSGTYVL